MRFAAVLAASLALLATACLSSTSSGTPLPTRATVPGIARDGTWSGSVSAGTWGGQHLGLVVTPAGATLEFDCAHGSISGPILLDSAGRFDVAGVNIQEHGGPIRQGEIVPSVAVHYFGTVSGSSMDLSFRAVADSLSGGPFHLALGRPPQVFKCL